MTSPVPEHRGEILERAKRLIERDGKSFSSQKELILKGLAYDVIVVLYHNDDALMVFWDAPQTICVVSSTNMPADGFVCDETADAILKFLQQRMILDDIANT